MPINRRLLNATVERDIPTMEFLAISEHLDGVTGERRRILQEELAEKIEKNYPYRKDIIGKTSGTGNTAPATRSMSIEEARNIADVHDAMLGVIKEAAMKGKE